MAENGNHARVEGSIAGQTFSVTTKDVISLLMFIMLCLALWLAWQANEKRLDIMQGHHLRLFDMVLEQNKLREAQTHQIYQWLSIVAYNQNRPQEEQIPLGLPLPADPDQKPSR